MHLGRWKRPWRFSKLEMNSMNQSGRSWTLKHCNWGLNFWSGIQFQRRWFIKQQTNNSMKFRALLDSSKLTWWFDRKSELKNIGRTWPVKSTTGWKTSTPKPCLRRTLAMSLPCSWSQLIWESSGKSEYAHCTVTMHIEYSTPPLIYTFCMYAQCMGCVCMHIATRARPYTCTFTLNVCFEQLHAHWYSSMPLYIHMQLFVFCLRVTFKRHLVAWFANTVSSFCSE